MQNPNLEGVAVRHIPSRQETGVKVTRIQRAGEMVVWAGDGGHHSACRRPAAGRGPRDARPVPARGGAAQRAGSTETTGDVVPPRGGDEQGRRPARPWRNWALDAPARRGGQPRDPRRHRDDGRARAGAALRRHGADGRAGGGLDRRGAGVGNSAKELNETHFIPLFLGLALDISRPHPAPSCSPACRSRCGWAWPGRSSWRCCSGASAASGRWSGTCR